MSVAPFEIDPSWPIVRDESRDQIDESEMEVCEVCNARNAVVLGERGGVETWLCGYCS